MASRMNIGGKLKCTREYVDVGGNHRFLVGETISIMMMSMTFCTTDVPRYKSDRYIIIEWHYIDEYFIPLEEYRENIIKELN